MSDTSVARAPVKTRHLLVIWLYLRREGAIPTRISAPKVGIAPSGGEAAIFIE
jgi:hypothetical protein